MELGKALFDSNQVKFSSTVEPENGAVGKLNFCPAVVRSPELVSLIKRRVNGCRQPFFVIRCAKKYVTVCQHNSGGAYNSCHGYGRDTKECNKECN
jgi:hypothetical protein